MDNDKFSTLLLQLTTLVEQLAKVHEEEVEEALLSERIEGNFHEDGGKSHNWEQEANASVHCEMNSMGDGLPMRTGEPVEETALVRKSWIQSQEDDLLLQPSQDEEAMLAVEKRVSIDSATDTSSTDHSSEQAENDFQVKVSHISINFSESSANNGMGSANLRVQRFRPRRPWSDHNEFDNVKVADVLQSQILAKPRQQQFRGSVQVRRSGHQPGTRYKSIHGSSGNYCDGFCDRYVISHPESRGRGIWVLLSMAFLTYDFIMVPVGVSFDLQRTQYSRSSDTIITLFWTLDVFFNFITGVRLSSHLEMRPRYIAIAYLKSYFFFDLLILLPEWITLVVDSFPGGPMGFLRVARWGRLARLLRLARILRIVKMKAGLRQMAVKFHLSTVYVQVTQGWLGLCLFYILVLHLLACAWYALGNALDHGWVSANGLKSATAAQLYVVSLRWCAGRLYGIMSQQQLDTLTEQLVDALLMYASMLLVSYCIGTVTAVCMARTSSRTANLWKCGMSYIQRHHISKSLDIRLVRVLGALHCGGAGEVAIEEESLLQALPMSLQQDLLFEARVDYLLTKPFFRDMLLLNERVVLHISTLAMSGQFSVEREVLFAYGDAGNAVLFLTSGNYWYASNLTPWEVFEGERDSSVKRDSSGNKFLRLGSFRSEGDQDLMSNNCRKLGAASVVSEAVLWTVWEHCGSLLAAEESTVLSLDAAKFADVIVQHTSPCMHMVRYAKLFVWHLNHCEEYDDLTEFPDLTMDKLNDTPYYGTAEDHFIFISHYKVEAGTEATLLRDSLEPVLRADLAHPANNFRSPIFIDSEDLIDLARLKEHVEKSRALVVLLTPGIFSRPWCLIEIVTATRKGVNLVPVEVQRPGSSYKYPDEEFYTLLLAGLLLEQDSVSLLEQETITLQDVEQSIRKVFSKIALPFSPHKSKSVREAELKDILKRCTGNWGQQELDKIERSRSMRSIRGCSTIKLGSLPEFSGINLRSSVETVASMDFAATPGSFGISSVRPSGMVLPAK